MAESTSTTELTASAVEQEAEKVIQFVQYFNHMDTTSPMLRFIIAGSVVAISLLFILVLRLVIRGITQREISTTPPPGPGPVIL
jgi:hypothetical protein